MPDDFESIITHQTQLHLGVGRPNDPVGNSDQSLGKILQIMVNDRNKKEDNVPVLAQTGYCNYQFLASVIVPFDWNVITMSVLGGLVAVTYADVQRQAGLNITFPTLELVQATQVYNLVFGATGMILGDAQGSVQEVPVELMYGSNQLRIPTQPQGKISFWVHPRSNLNYRRTIEPLPDYYTLEMVGQISYLPD